ncbi:hypothetical protein B0T19DRAFT_85628 [Cercophora scortea]|uniref:Rhodopsin domain-containing protein n=1 Tax=Cercophora scortea TaxID=314031 RepID=A0AAE0IUX1_9PEZI|nr:hypothetical protein B0T19DRAFT_85628 [Cercophora scortea]
MSTTDSTEWPPGWAEENKGPRIIAITVALTFITFLFVVGRIWSRMISLGKLASDDIVCIICICLGISYVAVSIVTVHHGGGRHIMTLSPEEQQSAIYFTVVSFVPGVLGFIVPKFACVILLAKLLNPGRYHLWFMWAASIIYGILGIAMLAINFGQCTPAAAQWGAVPGVCWDRKITVDYSLSLGIVSAIFDFYIAIYPTIVLFGLQLNWQKKLALASSLGFGYCAGCVTIYKCTTLPGLLHLADFTYAADDVIIWTNIEGDLVLIGACIPTLFPLVKLLFGKRALGGSTPPDTDAPSKPTLANTNGIVTIGSYAKNKKHRKSLSQFDNLDEADSKYIILEERSFHYSTTEVTDPEAEGPSVADQKQTKLSGW